MRLDRRGTSRATGKRQQLKMEGKLRGERAAVIDTASNVSAFDLKVVCELAYVLVFEL